MNSYIDDLQWASVDLETTGINPYKYEIIEIGATLFSLKGVENRFQQLIKVRKKQDPRSQKIHKITKEELEKDGIDLYETLNKFVAFIEDRPLIFHNAPFDLSFLVHGMKQENIELPSNYFYDNLFISRTYFPDRKSHSLDYLRKLYSVDIGDSHRALVDAEATAQVFILSLLDKYEQIKSKKDFHSFLRYHRRFHKFRLNLNKNFDRIENYFKYYIKTKQLLHIVYLDQEEQKIDINCLVNEIMIFNQSIFIKAVMFGGKEDFLIPLKHAEIHDPSKGIITIDSI